MKLSLKNLRGISQKLIFTRFKVSLRSVTRKNVRKKLLPDYLKNNYLEGAALSLVNSTDNLDNIWIRLKEAYGDTELPLGNKLHKIVKMGEIWKIREREKPVCALSLLICHA